MRKKRRARENGVARKEEVSSSVDDASTSEIEIKRKKLVLSEVTPKEGSSGSSTMKECDEAIASKSSPKNSGYDSSDSSSNEFEQPDLTLIEMENLKPKEEDIDDFAAIEDNILGDMGRLSESEESEFENVILNPSPVKKEPKSKLTLPLVQKSVTPSPEKTKVKDEKAIKKRPGRPPRKGKEETTPKSTSIKPSRKQTSRKGVPKTKAAAKLEEVKKPLVDVNKMDVTQLLAMGESFAESCREKSDVAMEKVEVSSEDMSGSDEEDWEEVDGEAEVKQEEKPAHVIPKEGVQITLDAPELFQQRKKKGFDLEACLKRRLNRNKRRIQVFVHKVHLLCWISHGRYLNNILNSQNLMGIALSLLPSNQCYPPNRTDLDYLEKFVNWFRKTVPIVPPKEAHQPNPCLEVSLEAQFRDKKALSKKDLVLMFVCAMRSLGIKARFILSLQPAPLKPPTHELCSIAPKKSIGGKSPVSGDANKTSEVKDETQTAEEMPSTSKEPQGKSSKKSTIQEPKGKAAAASAKKKVGNKSAGTKKSSLKVEDEAKSPKNAKTKPSAKASPSGKSETSESSTSKSRSQRCKKKNHYRESDSSDFEAEVKSKRKSNSQTAREKQGKVSSTSKKSAAKAKKGISDEDSDFEPEVLSVKKRKGVTVNPKDRKVVSSSSEAEEKKVDGPKTAKKKEGVDVWAEVFLEMEEKWISVDVPNGKVHCVIELHAKATSPVLYILAFGNDLCLKDVTRRYCPQWLSVTQKKRVDERWWKRTLCPFRPPRNAFDRKEEEEMDDELESRPLPTNITEYKSHPLYALKRHLLKFEALYPSDAPTLGFIRGEPVYSRDCVHQLHSRETWIKEAKLVRLGETPYKIVKARPKYDRMSGRVITDLPLELFGSWQVDDYIPPPAVDGKVPRNEYGNVDLYKPCMLPAGTVHLRLPGLNRVAKKLQIDCAPAVVGFDFHSGGSHPTFDGFIVCEEHKDALIDAWNQEQDEQEKRQREKRDKRVYGNWVRLVRGLLIRESLRHKYSFGDMGESSSSGKKKKTTKKS